MAIISAKFDFQNLSDAEMASLYEFKAAKHPGVLVSEIPQPNSIQSNANPHMTASASSLDGITAILDLMKSLETLKTP